MLRIFLFFSELTMQLDNEVPKILEKHNAPGVALAVVNGNEIVAFRSYGFANIESKKAITETTMFNVGSISKLVTAWGVMQLVDQRLNGDIQNSTIVQARKSHHV
jgi:CubicO group peptidase (beta-lactamase class C family)